MTTTIPQNLHSVSIFIPITLSIMDLPMK